MTLVAREATRDDLRTLFKLSVTAEQNDRVAPNSITLAQAAYESGSKVFGLWDGDVAVGLMATIDKRAYPWIAPEDDPQSLYLWRLMIDHHHQSKGYGTSALNLLVGMARELGVPRISSSVVNEDGAALPFYEAFGFKATGVIHEGEVVISLTL